MLPAAVVSVPPTAIVPAVSAWSKPLPLTPTVRSPVEVNEPPLTMSVPLELAVEPRTVDPAVTLPPPTVIVLVLGAPKVSSPRVRTALALRVPELTATSPPFAVTLATLTAPPETLNVPEPTRRLPVVEVIEPPVATASVPPKAVVSPV